MLKLGEMKADLRSRAKPYFGGILLPQSPGFMISRDPTRRPTLLAARLRCRCAIWRSRAGVPVPASLQTRPSLAVPLTTAGAANPETSPFRPAGEEAGGSSLSSECAERGTRPRGGEPC